MSEADTIDVRKIAHLARLELTDDEVRTFQAECEAIMAHVRELAEVDVDGVEPTAHATRITNVFRADEARDCADRDRYLANAPAVGDDAYIQVPKVLNDGSGDH